MLNTQVLQPVITDTEKAMDAEKQKNTSASATEKPRIQG
jgi:hypothetical protein